MAISVTHATVATGTDAGNGEVRKAQWNEAHTVTGVPDVFELTGTAASVGAVTTEVVLATISCAGGEIGPNGWVQVDTAWTMTNGANNKSAYIRVGGAAGTLFMTITSTTTSSLYRSTHIVNNNSQSSQKSLVGNANASGVGQVGSAASTASVDTSAAWDLVIAGQKANSGDTLTLEGYRVLVYYGA